MSSISAVISVVKEEISFLPQVLASISSFVDEIVLVDMTEDEEIEKIAEKYKARVFSHEFVNYVEPVRNFGIDKAKGEWVLILDPDEEVSVELAEKLKEVIKGNLAEYVRVPRKNIVFGKWLEHSRWWPDYNIRFFKKDYVKWADEIHSIPITTGRGIDLEAKEELAIIHHHYDSIEQFVERLNRYTTRQAQARIKEGYEFVWSDIVKKPASEIFSRFFAGQGYKDGLHGLAMSFLQAFYELVVILKVWEKKHKFSPKELSLKEVSQVSGEIISDTRYWLADSLVKENGGFLPRLKRKFKLP